MSQADNDAVNMAKIAEQAERYEDMVEAMKSIGSTVIPGNEEMRNLFSVAYKNVVGARRSAWRIVSSIHNKTEGDAGKIKVLENYKEKIEREVQEVCNEVLTTLDEMIAHIEDDKFESKTFFLKMKGDYLRYSAEIESDNTESKKKAKEAYECAAECAEGLATTHPIRLGLALNQSVFLYEIQGNPPAACEMAKKAFDEAISELDSLKEDSYKDSTLIMQLLRDNLTLWTSETEQENAE